MAGTVVEWYDFFLYATASAVGVSAILVRSATAFTVSAVYFVVDVGMNRIADPSAKGATYIDVRIPERAVAGRFAFSTSPFHASRNRAPESHRPGKRRRAGSAARRSER